MTRKNGEGEAETPGLGLEGAVREGVPAAASAQPAQAEQLGSEYQTNVSEAQPNARSRAKPGQTEGDLEKKVHRVKKRLSSLGIKERNSETGEASGKTDQEIDQEINRIGYERAAERVKDKPLLIATLDYTVAALRYIGLMSRPEALVQQDVNRINGLKDDFYSKMAQIDNLVLDGEMKWFDHKKRYDDSVKTIDDCEDIILTYKQERKEMMELLNQIEALDDGRVIEELKKLVGDVKEIRSADFETKKEWLYESLQKKVRFASGKISEHEKYRDDAYFKVKEADNNLNYLADNVNVVRSQSLQIRMQYVEQLEEYLTQPQVTLTSMQNVEDAYNLIEAIQSQGHVLKSRIDLLQQAMDKRYEGITRHQREAGTKTPPLRLGAERPDVLETERKYEQFMNDAREGIERRKEIPFH